MTVTVQDIIDAAPNATGADPHKIVHRWIDTGVLRPARPHPGQNQPRGYTRNDVIVARFVERLHRTGRIAIGHVWQPHYADVFGYLHATDPADIAPFLVVDLTTHDVHPCDNVRRAARCADVLVNDCRHHALVATLHDLHETP